MTFRTDRHNNPIAFTTEVASQGGLKLGVDFTVGDEFNAGGKVYYTARLLKDPVGVCIKLIDKVGFYNKQSSPRWTYMNGFPAFLWGMMDVVQKKALIQYMYHHEGGTELEKLF